MLQNRLSSNLKNKIKYLLIFLGFFIAFGALSIQIKARSELKQARLALNEKNSEKAIRHYFRALNWYAPIGASQTAADEFLILALYLEENDSPELAYSAFTRLRSGLYASRSLYLPRRDIIEQINPKIAWYLAAKKVKNQEAALNKMGHAILYYSLHDQPVSPNEKWVFATVFSFGLWVLGALWFITKFFSSKKSALSFKKRFKGSVFGLLLFAAGYSFWLLSMLRI